jgi:hypothetical protein
MPDNSNSRLKAEAKRHSTLWTFAAIVAVLMVLGGIYAYSVNDPQRQAVTPTVERTPSNIGPGTPVTPQNKK